MMNLKILGLLIFLSNSNGYAAFFKCTTNGKTAYQNKPCTPSATASEVTIHKQQYGQARESYTEYLKESHHNTEISAIKQQIQTIEKQIKTLRQKLANQRTALNKSINESANTAIGKERKRTLRSELYLLQQDIQTEIKTKTDKIRQLKKQLRKVKQ